MENPIQMDDLGVPVFSETSRYVTVINVPKVPFTNFHSSTN